MFGGEKKKKKSCFYLSLPSAKKKSSFLNLSTEEAKGKNVLPRREEIMVASGVVLINEDRMVEEKDPH